MSTGAVTKISKPLLRGMMRQNLKRDFTLAGVFSVAAALVFRYGIAEPRKKAYAEFYKNYDAQAEFEKMKEAGIFTSTVEED